MLPLWASLVGLVLGAVWGASARLWMRLVTTEEPSFTWSGTAFVVGVFAVTGMLAGLVHGARRRGWRGRPMVAVRLLGVLPLVLLVAGPGLVLAPALLLGALALGRGGWPRPVRTVLALLAALAVVAVHVALAQDWPHSTARLLAAVALCLVVYGGTAAALAQSVAVPPGGALPRDAQWLLLPLLLVPLLLVGGVGAGPVPSGLVAGLVVALLAALVPLGRRRRAARHAPEEVRAQDATSSAPAPEQRDRRPASVAGPSTTERGAAAG